jgi:hypothetical protein
MKVENKKPRNNLIPPSDGLEVLLHLTVTSFLFLIPRFWENFKSNKFTTSEITRAPEKKIK